MRGSVICVVLVALALLGACTQLKLGYGNGPMLGTWWLDRYADFSSSQRALVRAGLERWFLWHRGQQLDADLRQLESWRKALAADVTPAQVCDGWRRVERWRDVALLQMAGTAAEVAATLTPAQWKHLEERWQRTHQDWIDDHLQPDLAKRAEASLKRQRDQLESVYGRLDRSQRAWLVEQLAQMPEATEAGLQQQLEERRQRQAALRTWLRGPERSPEGFVKAVAAPASETVRQRQTARYEAHCRLLAAFHNRSTAEQRQHAAEVLTGWQEDLRGFVLSEPVGSAGLASPR